jgi:protein-disulfide isomerase
MRRMSRPTWWPFAVLASLFYLACAPPPQATTTPESVPAVAIAAPALPQDAERARAPAAEGDASVADGGDLGPVPVTRADPTWGSAEAPVTLVVFSDFQCPFCGKLTRTIIDLQRNYGPDKLRLVWKNNPLPFHSEARPAAEFAMAWYERFGNDGFWKLYAEMFTDQRRLKEVAVDFAAQAGMGAGEAQAFVARSQAAAKVDADVALGKQIGVTGTPASFINGVFLSGSQPYEKFAAIIDEQLAAARAETAKGTPKRRVYAALATHNWANRKPAETVKETVKDDDRAYHKVPVGKSPMRGKATALVTIVEFADYQCPFCARVEPTLRQLEADYGDKLRLVWKDNPLPFHPRAEPAAEVAREARVLKGDQAFWQVHDGLFIMQKDLDDQSLEAMVKTLGLNSAAVMKAVSTHKHKAALDEDSQLADDLQANGTPHFFINGRRLVGAQPLEKFKAVIDEELVKAEALVRGGVAPAAVYDRVQAGAAAPASAFEKKSIPAPTAANPSRGAAGARVVIQYFGDFQCPFCKRATDTLTALEREFPGQVRVVWRNHPLPMHPDAPLAAEAAMEAFKQRGSTGFFAMYELLFAAQGQPDALKRQALETYARQLGLDLGRFTTALDQSAHQAQIDADTKIADDAKISGTPAFVINGYYVSGAQSLAKFRRVVQLALAGK